jgi:hypothetical protein
MARDAAGIERVPRADNCKLAELEAHLFPESAPPAAPSPTTPQPHTPAIFDTAPPSMFTPGGDPGGHNSGGGITRDLLTGERSYETPAHTPAALPRGWGRPPIAPAGNRSLVRCRACWRWTWVLCWNRSCAVLRCLRWHHDGNAGARRFRLSLHPLLFTS